MSALGSAVDLGGAVVKISGDITQLQQTVAQARQLTQSIPPVLISFAANPAAIQTITTQIQTAMAAASTVTLTTAFNPAQASQALVNLTRQLQMQANAAPVVIPVTWGNPGPAPGGGPGAGSGGGGRGSGGGMGFPGGLGRLIGPMMAIRTAREVLEITSKETEAESKAQSPLEIAKARLTEQKELDNTVFGAGHLVRAGVEANAELWSAVGSRFGSTWEPNTEKKQEEEISKEEFREAQDKRENQQVAEHAARRAAMAQKGIDLGVGSTSEKTSAKASATFEAAREKREREYAIKDQELDKQAQADDEAENAGNISLKEQFARAARRKVERRRNADFKAQDEVDSQSQLAQSQQEAVEQKQREILKADVAHIESVAGTQVAGLQSGTAQAMMAGTGGSDTAFKNKQKEAQIELKAKQEAESKEQQAAVDRGESDYAATDDMEKEHAAKQKELDDQQAEDRVERERKLNQQLAQEAAHGQAAILNAEHKGYEARMTEFEASAKKRVENSRNMTAAQQAEIAQAIGQERQAIQIEAGEKAADFTMTQKAGVMAAGGLGFEASMAQEEIQGERTIAGMPTEQKIEPGQTLAVGTIIKGSEGSARITSVNKDGTYTAEMLSGVYKGQTMTGEIPDTAVIDPKATAQAAFNENIAAKKAKHAQDIAIEKGDLAGEASEAGLRGQGLGQLASTDQQIRQLKDQLATASPEVFAEKKKQVQAQLALMGKEAAGQVGDIHYRGMAATGFVAGEAVGENPLEAEERKRQKQDIDKAKNDVEKMGPSDLMGKAAKSLGDIVTELKRMFPGMVLDGIG